MEEHPFVDEIMAIPVPRNFKFPKLLYYDGSTDPQEHLTTFNVKMMVSHASPSVKCQVFPTTLEGATLMWFPRLPPRSVSS